MNSTLSTLMFHSIIGICDIC